LSNVEEKLSSIQAIRLWKIEEGRLQEIEKTKLDLEEKLEEWIVSDTSIISPNLLIIGRQVETSFGGIIDLLCIDENGDITIIELKRDKTPREITAQVLDYASWVKELTAEQIQNIANEYLKDNDFEEAYQMKFNRDLPDSINGEHKMLIVGSDIDNSSQRIINYLSESYGVAINAITFNYFKDEEREYLARTFLIEPSKAQIHLNVRRGKRRPNLTYEQLQSKADERGVGKVYNYLVRELRSFFSGIGTTRSSLRFDGQFRGSKRAILSFIPRDSDEESGLCWQVYFLRFMEHFNLNEKEARSILPPDRKPWRYSGAGPQIEEFDEWSGFTGYIKMEDAKQFVLNLKKRFK